MKHLSQSPSTDARFCLCSSAAGHNSLSRRSRPPTVSSAGAYFKAAACIFLSLPVIFLFCFFFSLSLSLSFSPSLCPSLSLSFCRESLCSGVLLSRLSLLLFLLCLSQALVAHSSTASLEPTWPGSSRDWHHLEDGRVSTSPLALWQRR